MGRCALLYVGLDIKIYFEKKYGQRAGRLVIPMGEAWQFAKCTFCAPMSGGSGAWMFLVRRTANVIVAASYGLLPTSPIQLRTMLPQEDLAGPLRPLVVQTNPVIWKFAVDHRV